MPHNYKKQFRTQYTKEALKEAVAAVNAGMTVNAASVKYKIPSTTLHTKLRTKIFDKKPGPDTCLTASQEETLAQWVCDCSNIGMPVGRKQIQNSVPLLLKSLNKSRKVGRRWYENFLNRNERVVERIVKNNAIARAAASEAGIRNWFVNVEKYLREKSLLDVHPSRVYSTDTVLLAGLNKSKESLCVQMTGNADGRLACPMIGFSQKDVSDKVYNMMLPGWIVGKSESGSVTAENFYEYIRDSFYPWLVANKIEFPVVLFLNGKVSNLTMTLTEFCKEHKIELVALHPNSTNVLHPLENFFSMLKMAWEKTVETYCNRSKFLAQEHTAPCLKSILDTLNVTELLTDGFSKCGLHPLSVDAVNFKKIPDRLLADKVQKERKEFGSFVSNKTRKSVEQTEKMQEEEVKSEPLRLAVTHDLAEQTEEALVKIEPLVLTGAHTSVEQRGTLTDVQFLELFEQKLDPNTLQTFKNAQQSDAWTGRTEDTTLYYIWKDAVNQALSDEHLVDLSAVEFDNANGVNQSEDVNMTEDPLKICAIEMEGQ